jgi:TPR repeat protein
MSCFSAPFAENYALLSHTRLENSNNSALAKGIFGGPFAYVPSVLQNLPGESMQFLLTKLLKYWHVRIVSIAAGVLLVGYAYIMPSRTVPSYTDVDAHSNVPMADESSGAGSSSVPSAASGSARPAGQAGALSNPWLAQNADVAEIFSSAAAGSRQQPLAVDFSEAIHHLRTTAEAGQPVAQFVYGHAFSSGFGVPRNISEAVRWYVKAAPLNSTGQPLVSSLISPLTYPEALDLYREAAIRGDLSAQLYFGLRAQLGEDGASNPAEAARWYRLAAAQGDAAAENNLGVLYHLGESMPKDDSEATTLFIQSANHGNASAQLNLGRLYLEGDGVPQTDRLAVQWLTRAANQGNAHAELLLSTLYAGGHSITPNIAAAYMWLNLASVSNSHARELRDRLEKVVPADQVAEGQRLTRQWLSDRHSVTL